MNKIIHDLLLPLKRWLSCAAQTTILPAVPAILTSVSLAAEPSIGLDLKTPLSQKIALAPAKLALAGAVSEDRRFTTVEGGEDWQVWLTDYTLDDHGTSCSVTLKVSLVHPSAPDRNSPVATQIVSYSFAKEPRDVLTTEDGTMRFIKGKIRDESKEFQAEAVAAVPMMRTALAAMVQPMITSEGQRTLNMKFRSQNLIEEP
jgi:hypothetical protein